MNIAKKVVSETVVTFSWADESVSTFDIKDLSEAIIARAVLHGLSQKLGDSYSGIKSVSEAKLNVNAVWEALKEGDWNRKGVSAGGVWVEALAQAAEVSFEEALEKWNSYSDDERKDMMKHPDVKQAKLEIDLVKAKAKAEAPNVKPLSL